MTNIALFAAGFITFANLYITQPLMPQFSNDYNVSPAVASLSLSAATSVLAFSLLLFGSLSEAWGRAQASSLYLFAYYMGSSIGGTLGGIFWMHFGWTGVVLFLGSALVVTFIFAGFIQYFQSKYEKMQSA